MKSKREILEELSELALKMEDIVSDLHEHDDETFDSGELESSIQTLVYDIQEEIDHV